MQCVDCRAQYLVSTGVIFTEQQAYLKVLHHPDEVGDFQLVQAVFLQDTNG